MSNASQRYLMISGDCHAGPPQPGYRPYLDKAYHDDFDRCWRARPDAAAAEAAVAGDLSALADILAQFMVATGASQAAAKSFTERAWRVTAGTFDSKIRNECLDEDGIVGEVIYPDDFIGNHPPFYEFAQPVSPWPYATRVAGVQAYNRWLADFCNEAPERRAGVILLPPAHDIDVLVHEVQTARKAGLRGGILMPPVEDGLPSYHDALYTPLWSAAEDLELPLCVHGGFSVAADRSSAYGTVEPLATVLRLNEVGFLDRRPLWNFIWTGIFQRHPKLRLVMAEGLAHWVPQELLRLDEMYDMWNLGFMHESLPLRPSDYWQRQCFITASFISRGEVEMRHDIHVPNLLWGSDFPHPEGTWPHTDACLRHAFSGLPEDEVRSILGENALSVHNFDVSALRPLADRIGPMPESVAMPRGERPADYIGMGMR